MLTRTAIKEAIRERFPTVSGSIAEINDSKPLTDLARIWNRAMYLRGYTEGNPEKRKLRKRS